VLTDCRGDVDQNERISRAFRTDEDEAVRVCAPISPATWSGDFSFSLANNLTKLTSTFTTSLGISIAASATSMSGNLFAHNRSPLSTVIDDD